MKMMRLLVLFASSFFLSLNGISGSLSSPSGREALHQQLIDLTSRLRVLSISVRPGCEDFSTLAYLHFGRGAQVTSAYVTNGESGENDIDFEYPAAIAATRRKESDEALTSLGGDTRFLNMPDLASISSTDKALEVWNKDTLRTRLLRLVAEVKPDLIVLTHDRFFPDNNCIPDILRFEISGVIKILAGDSRIGSGGIYDRWQVKRFLVASSAGGGLVAPTDTPQPLLRKTFRDIGNDIAGSYRSLRVQRRLWTAPPARYAVASPRERGKLKRIDDGLPGPTTRRLRSLAAGISRLAAQEQKISRAPRSYLKTVASLLDSTDALLLHQRNLSNLEQHDLVHWRGGLESLRVLLLGIDVTYSLSEHVLTERQLVFFTIDSIAGLPRGGKTEVYFPGVDRGWILNEAAVNKLPLALHEQYRLVSPERVDYDLPFSSFGMNRSVDGTTLYVFIIHHAENRDENFVYRITPRIRFAPRFEIEVLTPVVRVVQGERVEVRVTNHSRDGVADSLAVRDSLVLCNPVPFRLGGKESTSTKTLSLNWRSGIPDGTFLIPVRVGNASLTAFAARKFDMQVGSPLHVGIVSQYLKSPLVDALRRLGVGKAEAISVSEMTGDRLQGLDVVILDRRALSFVRDTSSFCASVLRFAENGGRVVSLSQDASIWNASGFSTLLKLQEGGSLPADSPAEFDTSDNIAKSPNELTPADLSGWIFRRSYGHVVPTSQVGTKILARSQVDGSPLVVSVPEGRGRLTYVDLCLIPQLVNINPGAFRILANIISL